MSVDYSLKTVCVITHIHLTIHLVPAPLDEHCGRDKPETNSVNI